MRAGSVKKWGSSCSRSTWSRAAKVGTPSSRAPAIVSSSPASNPPPLVTSASASRISATWRADAWKSWGSALGGISTSTLAPSPTSWDTTSPRIVVVTTTDGPFPAPTGPAAPHPAAARAAAALTAATGARGERRITVYNTESHSHFCTPMDALTADDLVLAYGTRPALIGATFTVPAGASVALVGPNGSGKSTLLRAAAGLVEPVAGRLAV